MSLSDRERLVNRLVGEGWLAKGQQGEVGLGQRTFLELKGYLRSIPGVVCCDLCDDAAIVVRPKA